LNNLYNPNQEKIRDWAVKLEFGMKEKGVGFMPGFFLINQRILACRGGAQNPQGQDLSTSSNGLQQR
jgi:hypothetical protein